jgi:hypothetical protein
MNTKVLVVRHQSCEDVRNSKDDAMQSKIDGALARLGKKWEVVSASTNSCTRIGHNYKIGPDQNMTSEPETFWITTILLKKV